MRRKAQVWKNMPEIWMHGAKLVFKHAELQEVAQSWLNEGNDYHSDFQIINFNY